MFCKINKKLSVITIIILHCLLAACEDNQSGIVSQKGYTADSIRISYTTNYGMVIPHIIKLRGLLNNKLPEGVTVEWNMIDNSTAIRESLATNRIDIGFTTLPTVIAGIENGANLIILARSAIQQVYIYSNNPDIERLDDIMPYHKITMPNIGATTSLALALISKEKYGEYGRFENNTLVMQNADVLASLASSREIDCAAISFPSLSAADKMENLRRIADLTPTINKYAIGTVCVGAREFVDSNPVLVQAVNEASQEAMEFLNNHSAEAAELLAREYSGVDPAEIEEQIKAVPFSPELSESAYNTVAGLMYETGILSTAPEPFSALPNYDSIPKLP